MNAKKILNEIGLKDKKAEVYLACLEMGGATAYLIAKKIGLKRPTVYDIVDQLLKEGLIYKSVRGDKKRYYPADPMKILQSNQEKEKRIKSIMPELQNLYNSPKAKPQVKYFEGEGIKEIYEDSLRSLRKGDEILAYIGEDIIERLPAYSDEYVKRRVEKGIVLRGIYKKEMGMINRFLTKSKEQLRLFRVLEEKYFPVNNETLIYKNKIAVASFGKEMFGVIIESEEIARCQKAVFELAWRGAEMLSKT